MRLNAKILKNVADVNNWQYATQASVQEGQSNEIYLQLVDFDKVPGNDKSTVLPENPLRYISQAAVAALEASFSSIDTAQEFTVIGTQPFADDKSIWKLILLPTQLPKSGNFKLKLTEDGNMKSILVKNSLIVDLINVGSC